MIIEIIIYVSSYTYKYYKRYGCIHDEYMFNERSKHLCTYDEVMNLTDHLAVLSKNKCFRIDVEY